MLRDICAATLGRLPLVSSTISRTGLAEARFELIAEHIVFLDRSTAMQVQRHAFETLAAKNRQTSPHSTGTQRVNESNIFPQDEDGIDSRQVQYMRLGLDVDGTGIDGNGGVWIGGEYIGEREDFHDDGIWFDFDDPGDYDPDH